MGSAGSTWDWIRYELITTLLGCLPGAAGLLLRKIFYPALFRTCGRSVISGRSLLIRNPQNIELGNGVFIDDFCLLDGRGGSEEPVIIGERVTLNRGVTVQAKIGTIRIGADSDIGAGCSIISQGGVFLGKEVSLGGNCDIGGGSFATETANPATGSTAARGEEDSPKHRKFTKGPVRIGDRTVTGVDVGSIGLVNLIDALEETIEMEYGVTANLADQRSVDESIDPLSSVARLVAYLEGLLAKHNHA